MQYSQKEKVLISTLAKCEDIEDAREYYLNLVEFRKDLLQESYITGLTKLLDAISHIDRIIILRILMEKNRCVCELEAILGKSQSNISYHLKILEELDLIKGWKKGKFTHYSAVRKSLEHLRYLFNTLIDDEVMKSNPNLF